MFQSKRKRTIICVCGLVAIVLLTMAFKLGSAMRYRAQDENENPIVRFMNNLTSLDEYTVKYHYFKNKHAASLKHAVETPDDTKQAEGCDVSLAEYYFDGVHVRAMFKVQCEPGDEMSLESFGYTRSLSGNVLECMFATKSDRWHKLISDDGERLSQSTIGNTKYVFFNSDISTLEALGKMGTPGVISLIKLEEFMALYDQQLSYGEAVEEKAMATYQLDISTERFVYKDTGMQILVTPMGITWMEYIENHQIPPEIESLSFIVDGKKQKVLEGHEPVGEMMHNYCNTEEQQDFETIWNRRWQYDFKNSFNIATVDSVEIKLADGTTKKITAEKNDAMGK